MAEEDLGSVQSTGTRVKTRPKGNWLLDAALAGLGTATVMGPLAGLAVGVGRGIANRRLDKNALDQIAEEQASIQASNKDVQAQFERFGMLPGITEIDKAQLGALQTQRQMLARAMNSADPNVRQAAADKYLSLMGEASSWLDDVESRQESQHDSIRSTYSDSFKDLRERYRNTQSSVSEATNASKELLSYIDGMSDDELNKPFARGRIAQLLQTSARGIAVDTPDAADALGTAASGIGAVPNPIAAIIGGIVKGGIEAFKNQDFKITGSDVRRAALASIDQLNKYGKEQLGRFGEEAKALTSTGQRFGIVADNDTVFRYVTGQSEDAPIQQAPPQPEAEAPRGRAPNRVERKQSTTRAAPTGPNEQQRAILNSRAPQANIVDAPSAAEVLREVRSRVNRRMKRPTND